MRRLDPAARVRGVQRTLIRRMFDAAGPDAINLGLGEPDLATPPSVAAEGIDAIREGATRYTATAGDPALREAIAKRYGQRADRIVITAGSQEALFVAMMAMIDSGDEVLVPDPGYPAYATLVRLAGGRAVTYPLRRDRGYRVDPVDLEARLTDATRAVVVCSPGNPTGAIHADRDLRRIARTLSSRGVAWLSDEVYREIRFDDRAAPSLHDHDPDGGVVVSGFSKDLAMTGWRIGWASVPPGLYDAVLSVHQHVVTCAPSIAQRAGRAAAGAVGDEARREHLGILGRRRACMLESLDGTPGVRFDPPEGGLFCFVAVDGCDDSLGLALRLLHEHGVLTIPGVAFGPGGEGCVRLSFAASDAAIRDGVARFRRGIGQESPDAAGVP